MSSSLVRSEKARGIYQQLVSTLQLQRAVGIGLGQLLWKLKANNLFKEAIGQGIETWNDFLKMPEIGLEMSEANRAMELYEIFVIKYGYTMQELSEAKTKSLHYLLPLAKDASVNESRIRELVESAKHLTQSQFREEIYDSKPGAVANATYQFVLMRRRVETGTLQIVPNVDDQLLREVFAKANLNLEAMFIPEIL